MTAYPTASRERRKQQECEATERGEQLVVKTRFKHIENHFDDSGGGFTWVLGNNQVEHYAASTWISALYLDADDESDGELAPTLDFLPSLYFLGAMRPHV